MENGGQIKSSGAHGGGGLSVKFTHDNRLVSCGRDRWVKVWDQNGASEASPGTLARRGRAGDVRSRWGPGHRRRLDRPGAGLDHGGRQIRRSFVGQSSCLEGVEHHRPELRRTRTLENSFFCGGTLATCRHRSGSRAGKPWNPWSCWFFIVDSLGIPLYAEIGKKPGWGSVRTVLNITHFLCRSHSRVKPQVNPRIRSPRRFLQSFREESL